MGGRRGVWVAAWTSTLVSACSLGPGRAPPGEVVPWPATLFVESAAADHVAVRVNGFRIGTITRGANCISVPASPGPLVLDFVTLDGSARVSEPIRLARGGHWTLQLGPGSRLESDLLSLRPSERGCAPGDGGRG